MLVLTACGGETMEEKLNRRLSEAVQEATAAASGVDSDSVGAVMNSVLRGLDSVKFDKMGDVEVINFRELKPLLPSRTAGLAQEKITGETQSMFGLTFSQVQARYGTGSEQLEIELTDSGGAGMLLSSMAGFTNLKVDKETEDGSERTLELDGHKAYEKERNRNGKLSSSLAVLINDRFILNLNGDGLTAAQLREAYEDIDIAALPVPADD